MIIVTGASRGLGKAITDRLRERGTEVLGLARQVEDSSEGLRQCDVSDAEAVKQVATALRKEKREVSGLVNAAGIASMNLALTTPAASVQRILQTNLMGTIFCCQQFAPLMVRRRAGSIVNFSTIAVALGLKGESVYVASKAGVEGFSRAFAREVAGLGVRVNCVAPGPIRTDLLQGVSDEQIDRILAEQVIPKAFAPEDVADLVEFFLGPQSASLSGEVLHVGGV